jgi:hypothetical protein
MCIEVKDLVGRSGKGKEELLNPLRWQTLSERNINITVYTVGGMRGLFSPPLDIQTS